MDEDDRAQIAAIQFVVAALVVYAKKSHPDFEDFARRHMDTVLGLRLARQGSPTELERKIREVYMDLIELKDDSVVAQTLPSTEKATKPTLRKRFLNWLQHGW